ncbi:hypothetical protein [Mycobacterium gordonae]|uniref:hypothetical protein n=1 Tax=Mycobacterium gordonae TaxID=1778 RepID=UPI0012EA65FF|nr:hypothetical protein [Mycobacterium gordonae]
MSADHGFPQMAAARYGGSLGHPGTEGGIQVGAHILEGDPSPANTCNGSPICLPGL